jgi:hypothetical protein
MTEPYTAEQIAALRALLSQLRSQLPNLREIAGHEVLDTTEVAASDDAGVTGAAQSATRARCFLGRKCCKAWRSNAADVGNAVRDGAPFARPPSRSIFGALSRASAMTEATGFTELLAAWREGELAARDAMVNLVYHEVRAIARRQLAAHRDATLAATELAHEGPDARPRARRRLAEPAPSDERDRAGDAADPGRLGATPPCAEARRWSGYRPRLQVRPDRGSRRYAAGRRGHPCAGPQSMRAPPR